MATGTIPMSTASYFTPTTCPNDLNDITVSGFYAWFNSPKTNAPTASANGTMLHVQTSAVRMQTVWAHADNNVYYRTKTGTGGWTGWKLISASAVVV